VTEPLTVLDPAVLDELRPPCEIGWCEPKPAEWLAKFRCNLCGHQPWQLMCERDFRYFEARGRARCTGCGRRETYDYDLIAAERLS